MATYDGNMSLTDDLIAKLAESIAAPKMETIAIRYLKIPSETIENDMFDLRGNATAFNRSLLNRWKCSLNPGDNQVQVSQIKQLRQNETAKLET